MKASPNPETKFSEATLFYKTYKYMDTGRICDWGTREQFLDADIVDPWPLVHIKRTQQLKSKKRNMQMTKLCW